MLKQLIFATGVLLVASSGVYAAQDEMASMDKADVPVHHQKTYTNLYLGIGLGFSKANYSVSFLGQKLGNDDIKSGFSQQLIVGYQITDIIGVETDYIHYGANRAQWSRLPGSPPEWPIRSGIRFDQHSVSLLAVLRSPSLHGFRGFIKVGPAYNHGTWSSFDKFFWAQANTGTIASYDKASATYGAGISYDVPSPHMKLSIKAEWQGMPVNKSVSVIDPKSNILVFKAPTSNNVFLIGVTLHI